MRIAVMGAGGIGGYVGGRLVEIGEQVHFLARGLHLEALRRDGLRIESPAGDATLPVVHATDDPATVGPVDLVLFAVKLGDTDTAARALAPLIAGQTRIVTLQNGIDSRAMIARHVEERRVAAGSIYISASIRTPGVIRSPGGAQRMIVDGLGGDAVIGEFVAACGRTTGLDVSVTADIERVLWEKFIALVAFSGVTCLTRGPIGAVLEHPETVAFTHRLVAENVAVAQASGLSFAADKADSVVALFRELPHAAKSSMLIDLEAGKPLELPWLAGRIVELGQAHGVETPANAAVAAALAPHVDGARP